METKMNRTAEDRPVRIGAYELTAELITDHAGFSRWGFCRKDGRDYFIKEFLKPVFPVSDNLLSEEMLQKKQQACKSFDLERTAYYERLGKCRTGNLMAAEDFFRFGPRYYVVTEKVDASDMAADLSEFTPEQKECFLRSLLYSIARMHEAGLVHGDLKPKNILIKRTKGGFCTAKIIDFDAGFIISNQPQEVQIDFTYMAPEMFRKVKGQEVFLNEKIDVFALGLLLHRYWIGRMPEMDEKYRYAFQVVIDGGELKIADALPEKIRKIICSMLSLDPDERPAVTEVLQVFRELHGKKQDLSREYVHDGSTQKKRKYGKSKYFYVPHGLN